MMFRCKCMKRAGLVGFFFLYLYKCTWEFLKSLIYSVLLTICLIIVFSKSNITSLDLLQNILSISIKVSPPLLAFTLAGYSVIMGKDTKGLKEHKTTSGITMYQQLNATFIAMLLASLISLAITIIISFIAMANISTGSEGLDSKINFCAFIAVSFFLSYTLFAVKDLISNLFSLGQYINHVGNSEHI